MCQLTYVNTHNPILNQTAMLVLSSENSRINRDGWGFYTDSGLFKTTLPACIVTNADVILRTRVSKSPVMSHVRLASRGIEVSEENVHPFEFKNLIAAHNGTLWFKGEAVTYGGDSRPSDTRTFFTAVDALLTANKDMLLVDAINEVMKDTRGKFAFLIFDKRTNDYYAIRGKTAELHCFALKDSKGTNIGYIVNTDKECFVHSWVLISNISGLLGGPTISSCEEEELTTETAYILDSENVIEVGKVKENPTYVATAYVTSHTVWPSSAASTSSWNTADPDRSTTAGYSTPPLSNSKVEALVKWMDKQALSPRELELIFETCLGISLVDLEEDDIKFFFEKVAPKVSASKHIREFLLRRGIIELPTAFYEKYKLQFPLTFNPLGVVIAAIKDFIKPVSLEGTPE